jgi:hypothetical protein
LQPVVLVTTCRVTTYYLSTLSQQYPQEVMCSIIRVCYTPVISQLYHYHISLKCKLRVFTMIQHFLVQACVSTVLIYSLITNRSKLSIYCNNNNSNKHRLHNKHKQTTILPKSTIDKFSDHRIRMECTKQKWI